MQAFYRQGHEIKGVSAPHDHTSLFSIAFSDITHPGIVFRRVTIRVLLLQALLQCIIIRLSDLHLAEKTPPKFLLFPNFRVDFT